MLNVIVVMGRLVRDPGLVDEGTICLDHAIETPCSKVQMPKGLQEEYVHEHIVSYSDKYLLIISFARPAEKTETF